MPALSRRLHTAGARPAAPPFVEKPLDTGPNPGYYEGMSTTDTTTTQTDREAFTTARRAARASWSSIAPGVEATTRRAGAGGSDITVVLVFGPEGKFVTATVAVRIDDEEGPRGVITVTVFAKAVEWALGS